MLRLLFTSAIVIPITFLPWVKSQAEPVADTQTFSTYDSYIAAPSVDALENCLSTDIPVFFHDTLILTHSAEFLTESLQTAKHCGSMDIDIIPVLPEEAGAPEVQISYDRVEELDAFVSSATNKANLNAELKVVEKPVEEDVSTLYMNGRAAIVRIQPR